jgi:hypothetical protein
MSIANLINLSKVDNLDYVCTSSGCLSENSVDCQIWLRHYYMVCQIGSQFLQITSMVMLFMGLNVFRGISFIPSGSSSKSGIGQPAGSTKMCASSGYFSQYCFISCLLQPSSSRVLKFLHCILGTLLLFLNMCDCMIYRYEILQIHVR